MSWPRAWRGSWWLAPLGAALAMGLYRNFTVDDAFIAPRYAYHLHAGLGYRFNAHGPVTDGVTPLPWALLLGLWPGSPLALWYLARTGGALAWLAATCLLGREVERTAGGRGKWLAVALLAGSAPLGAWAVAGMETALVLALTTVAVAWPRTARGALVASVAAGAAGAFRPELFSFVLGVALARAPGLGWNRRALLLPVLATVPWFLVVLGRWATFGFPAPLALWAKPSDLPHGAMYVGGYLLTLGYPLLALGRGSATLPNDAVYARGLVAAFGAHAATVALAGGDWMPLGRLLVPALPALVVVAARVLAHGSRVGNTLRAAGAAAGAGWVLANTYAAAAEVVPVRLALQHQVKPWLRSGDVVAALDVGWLGAAVDTPLVDLAGLTDPTFALLPGGHTSKRVPATVLAARDVNVLVLLQRPASSPVTQRADGGPFARTVEEYVAGHDWTQRHFTPVATVSAGLLTYVVLRRNEPASALAPRYPLP